MRLPTGNAFVVLGAFAAGIVAGGVRDSLATQKSTSGERFEYRVLKEEGIGTSLNTIRSRDALEPGAPPKALEELLNTYARDGWEVEDLRLRPARSPLQASRRPPLYYLYSFSGDTGPRFLRLRRRLD